MSGYPDRLPGQGVTADTLEAPDRAVDAPDAVITSLETTLLTFKQERLLRGAAVHVPLQPRSARRRRLRCVNHPGEVGREAAGWGRRVPGSVTGAAPHGRPPTRLEVAGASAGLEPPLMAEPR
jgi:hypothetical protein